MNEFGGALRISLTSIVAAGVLGTALIVAPGLPAADGAQHVQRGSAPVISAFAGSLQAGVAQIHSPSPAAHLVHTMCILCVM